MIISTCSNFPGPGSTSDPLHISLLNSPSCLKPVTLYTNISLYLSYLALLLPLRINDGTMILQTSGASYWVRQCHIPEKNPQPQRYQINDHDNQSNITTRWAQRWKQGLYNCNSCYCSLYYHCATHKQLEQTVPTTKRISTSIWQPINRTVTIIWAR